MQVPLDNQELPFMYLKMKLFKIIILPIGLYLLIVKTGVENAELAELAELAEIIKNS